MFLRVARRKFERFTFLTLIGGIKDGAPEKSRTPNL